ncbi:hypothetical protein E2562_011327 [Oryza meyeriana var. granulata]|uniref:Uncharacterized protein n=1 Tax=Oryza meyeriana var. granulata TaxID=110450 RepID=A0A6G1BVC2_9ORYZ|nr:hypothetical protein E2562_011327 [Oryza meyeriana var. granulata]
MRKMRICPSLVSTQLLQVGNTHPLSWPPRAAAAAQPAISRVEFQYQHVKDRVGRIHEFNKSRVSFTKALKKRADLTWNEQVRLLQLRGSGT